MVLVFHGRWLRRNPWGHKKTVILVTGKKSQCKRLNTKGNSSYTRLVIGGDFSYRQSACHCFHWFFYFWMVTQKKVIRLLINHYLITLPEMVQALVYANVLGDMTVPVTNITVFLWATIVGALIARDVCAHAFVRVSDRSRSVAGIPSGRELLATAWH